jgi:hypothetical protein
VSPHETKRRGELPPLATPPRVGPKTLANPQPTGVGKRGVQGGVATMAGGCGWCPPDLTPWPSSLRGKGEISAKLGVEGHSPLPGGMGDVPPKAKNRGRVAHPCNPATSGTQNVGEPQAHEGGKRGSRRAKPPGRGYGGCAPTNSKGDE